MFHYFIESGKVLISDDFSKVNKTCEILDNMSVKIHLEYPNGVIMDCILDTNGADVTINKELIQNTDGDYELKN